MFCFKILVEKNFGLLLRNATVLSWFEGNLKQTKNYFKRLWQPKKRLIRNIKALRWMETKTEVQKISRAEIIIRSLETTFHASNDFSMFQKPHSLPSLVILSQNYHYSLDTNRHRHVLTLTSTKSPKKRHTKCFFADFFRTQHQKPPLKAKN